MPRRSPRVSSATLLVGGAVVAGLMVGVVPAIVSSSAASIGASVGYFSDPVLETEGLADSESCLWYGTGEPVTVHRKDPAIQEEFTLGAHNEIRWGHDIRSEAQMECVANPENAAGLMFAGAHTDERVGDYIEIGQLTRGDNPVLDSLESVTLNTFLTISNPETGKKQEVAAAFDVRIHEAFEQYQATPSEPAPDPKACRFQPGAINPFDGSVIPRYVGDLNGPATTIDLGDGARPYSPCADGLSAAASPANAPIEWDDTTAQVRVAGWTGVTPDGQCDLRTFVDGAFSYTQAGRSTTVCLLGEIAPTPLTVEGTLSGQGDGVLDVRLTPVDETRGRLFARGRGLFRTIPVNDGFGSIEYEAVPPGLYTLTQESAPEGYVLSDVTCTRADGSSAVILRDGHEYIDLDSSSPVTCAVADVLTGKLKVSAVSSAGRLAPLSLRIEGPGLNEPARVVLADNGDGASAQTVSLPAGEYAVTMSVPDGWTLTGTEFAGGPGSGVVGSSADDPTLTLTVGGGTQNSLRVSTAASASDLAVTADASAEDVIVGDRVNWTIHVVNEGAAAADDVVLTQKVPDSVTEVDLPQEGNCHVLDGMVTCSPGTVQPGEEVVLPIGMVLGAEGPVESVIHVRAQGVDSEADNNTAHETVRGVMPPSAEQLADYKTDQLLIGLLGFSTACLALAALTLSMALRRMSR